MRTCKYTTVRFLLRCCHRFSVVDFLVCFFSLGNRVILALEGEEKEFFLPRKVGAGRTTTTVVGISLSYD